MDFHAKHNGCHIDTIPEQPDAISFFFYCFFFACEYSLFSLSPIYLLSHTHKFMYGMMAGVSRDRNRIISNIFVFGVFLLENFLSFRFAKVLRMCMCVYMRTRAFKKTYKVLDKQSLLFTSYLLSSSHFVSSNIRHKNSTFFPFLALLFVATFNIHIRHVHMQRSRILLNVRSFAHTFLFTLSAAFCRHHNQL